MAKLPSLRIIRCDNSSAFISHDYPNKDFAKCVRKPGMFDTKYNITGTFNDKLWRKDLAIWNLKAQQSNSKNTLMNGFVVCVTYLLDEGIPNIYSTADTAKTNPLPFSLISSDNNDAPTDIAQKTMISIVYIAIPNTIEDPNFGEPGHPVKFIKVNPSPTL